MPGWKVTARFLGSLLGGMIDAETSMLKLIIHGIAIYNFVSFQ